MDRPKLPAQTSPLRAAQQARARGDWAEVLVQARHMMRRKPDEATGYVLATTALRRLRRPAELRDLLIQALQRFPDHPKLGELGAVQGILPPGAIVQQPGSLAQLRQAAQEAVQRSEWERLDWIGAKLRDAMPHDPSGFVLSARALRELRRARQADAVSRAGAEAFPNHPPMVVERAAVLQQRKQFQQAALCFAHLRVLQPDVPAHYSRGAAMLIFQGDCDFAEQLVVQGLQRFGTDLELLVQYAMVAARRNDGPLTRTRWEAVRRISPDDPRLLNYDGSRTMAERLRAVSDHPASLPEQPPAHEYFERDDAAVLKQFESLGGNCEFGLAQRAAGIEPLGLLRFSGMVTDDLVGLLRCGFEDVGSEQHSELFLNAQNEFMLIDRRFPSFWSHTFISAGETDPAVLPAKLRKRAQFLRDKLLAELRSGKKIFLFRPANGTLDDSAIDTLNAEFRRLSDGMLLCIRNAAEGCPPMEIVSRRCGLMVATMPGYTAKLDLGFVREHRYRHWITLCRAALEAASARRSG
jgi:Flp pilus assembly protein TadD